MLGIKRYALILGALAMWTSGARATEIFHFGFSIIPFYVLSAEVVGTPLGGGIFQAVSIFGTYNGLAITGLDNIWSDRGTQIFTNMGPTYGGISFDTAEKRVIVYEDNWNPGFFDIETGIVVPITSPYYNLYINNVQTYSAGLPIAFTETQTTIPEPLSMPLTLAIMSAGGLALRARRSTSWWSFPNCRINALVARLNTAQRGFKLNPILSD